ncbi:hypothetical protein ZHAS_00018338 [Anopheles sinensis]|uniref:Uncharacterized protein n=1 Tax=Anopheles sinensis TaxID=74873 RepID=A0A084WJ66_ANOSI|nr:hypothetical protein ZHAS_00018338 [Anopheles sinensis]
MVFSSYHSTSYLPLDNDQSVTFYKNENRLFPTAIVPPTVLSLTPSARASDPSAVARNMSNMSTTELLTAAYAQQQQQQHHHHHHPHHRALIGGGSGGGGESLITVTSNNQQSQEPGAGAYQHNATDNEQNNNNGGLFGGGSNFLSAHRKRKEIGGFTMSTSEHQHGDEEMDTNHPAIDDSSYRRHADEQQQTIEMECQDQQEPHHHPSAGQPHPGVHYTNGFASHATAGVADGQQQQPLSGGHKSKYFDSNRCMMSHMI